MLEIEKDETVVRGFRIPKATADLLAEMAELLDTSQVKVIIALINQYGPPVIESEKKLREQN